MALRKTHLLNTVFLLGGRGRGCGNIKLIQHILLANPHCIYRELLIFIVNMFTTRNSRKVFNFQTWKNVKDSLIISALYMQLYRQTFLQSFFVFHFAFRTTIVSGFLLGFLGGTKPIVMQISFVLPIFLLFQIKIIGGQKSFRGTRGFWEAHPQILPHVGESQCVNVTHEFLTRFIILLWSVFFCRLDGCRNLIGQDLLPNGQKNRGIDLMKRHPQQYDLSWLWNVKLF